MPEANLDLTDSVGFDIPWTAVDSATWRAFVETTTGKRLLGQLLTKRPGVFEMSDLNRRVIQSGINSGFEEAARVLQYLTHSKSVKEV